MEVPGEVLGRPHAQSIDRQAPALLSQPGMALQARRALPSACEAKRHELLLLLMLMLLLLQATRLGPTRDIGLYSQMTLRDLTPRLRATCDLFCLASVLTSGAGGTYIATYTHKSL